MMLLGFGDTTDPTSIFTDALGITCRQYETMTATDGSIVCNQCAMPVGPDGTGLDMNGNPISCAQQGASAPPLPVVTPMPPSPVAPPVMIPPSTAVAPIMPIHNAWRRWMMFGLGAVAVAATTALVVTHVTKKRAA